MSRVRASVLASAADRYASQALTVLTLAIMSRLLTPAEIGLYLVVSSLIMLGDNFRAFGVGLYIVQAPELRRDELRAAFTITLALSVGISLAFYAGRGVIAGFYAAPELAHLLAVACLGFLAIPFGSPLLAVLQRELAFGTLAVLNVAAAALNSVVTITLAVLGHGPVSYVWGYVASSVLLSVAAVALRPDIGVFRPSFAETRRLLGFGGMSTVIVLVNLVNDMVPRLAFAKILGFDAAGFYGRALTVCQLPDRVVLSAVQPVILPAMAAHARAGGDLGRSYLRGLGLVTSVQWPVLVVLALLADPVVRLLLGAQWDGVAPLVRIIALGMTALAPALMTLPILIATGRIRDALIATAIVTPPSIAIAIGAAHIGLTAVAASVFVTAPFQMAVALHFVRRATGLRWGELASAAAPSLALAAGAALVPVLVVLASPHGFDLGWIETAGAALGAAAGWAVALRVVDHPLRIEIATLVRMAAGAVRARQAAAPPPTA